MTEYKKAAIWDALRYWGCHSEGCSMAKCSHAKSSTLRSPYNQPPFYIESNLGTIREEGFPKNTKRIVKIDTNSEIYKEWLMDNNEGREYQEFMHIRKFLRVPLAFPIDEISEKIKGILDKHGLEKRIMVLKSMLEKDKAAEAIRDMQEELFEEYTQPIVRAAYELALYRISISKQINQ